MKHNNNTIIILAAGKGTRMDSNLPKVLHKINGESMINRVINVAKKLNPIDIIVIVGFKKELVINEVSNDNVTFVVQKEQKGTGHAILQCMPKITKAAGNILILSGDVPLISYNTLMDFIDFHNKQNSKASLISTDLENPDGYGRIVKNNNNRLTKIVEHKDANKQELSISEINSGIYIFDSDTLKQNIVRVDNNNAQKEYYLTQIFDFIKSENSSVNKIKNSHEILGVNTIHELEKLEELI